MKIDAILAPNSSEKAKFRLFSCPISAGIPSSTEDYLDDEFDIDQLINHPNDTYFMRVRGNSMEDVGIDSGDWLSVDCDMEAMNGDVVIASIDNEYTVKRLFHRNGEIILLAENDDYEPLRVQKDSDFKVCGVVTNVIHRLRKF
ncbi:SOS response transcriptional repressor, RecA-mediated autopeptidase [Synechococcus sp. PCC 7502]|uniref:LexA family protein n=1 Tax=Synechococcus sp. PCC 7502 TaxID=1173263 RepID=UPI00029FC4AD|nr:translesion error-prone DNA polymerase V autoproteolytic subunit [Synechococcus sp. PCC 7502]AFY75106.1 SOS response transcriptional repressor, RecA-mediated autopeptidase [Synechococcus sp. PCC 7502]